MDTTDTSDSAILLDEHDAAAVSALLIRMVRLDDELTRDRELASKVSARIASNSLLRGKMVAAFGIFGFDTGDGLWPKVRETIGGQAYDRAVAIARNQELPLLEKLVDQASADEGSQEDATEPGARVTPRVRDAILEYLQSVGDEGAVVKEVRRHLLDAHEISVHEKTPGMTLYRLLKEGLVTRRGRTWFASRNSENNENEAPHGGAAGASETR